MDKSSGSDVLLAVRHYHKRRSVQPPNSSTVEHVWVQLFVSGYNLFICVIYVAPDLVKDATLASQHCKSLEWITSRMTQADKILIMADFNMRAVSWTQGPSEYLYPNLAHPTQLRLQL